MIRRAVAYLAIIGLAIATFLGYAFYQRNAVAKRYSKAMKCIDDEDYQMALQYLDGLSNYKDGRKLIKQARQGKIYKNALTLVEEKKYRSAVIKFNKIKDYKDSAEQIKKTKYLLGVQLYKEGKFTQARCLFNQLGGYRNGELYLAKINIENQEHDKSLLRKAGKKFEDESL